MNVDVSPDGSALTYSTSETPGEKVWVKELPAGPVTLLTPWPRHSRRPVWSRDGTSVQFVSNAQGGHWHARSVRSDGSSPAPDTILDLEEDPLFEVVPAGSGTLFRAGDMGPNRADVGYAAGDTVRWLLDAGYNEHAVTLSPDGRWMAYVAGFSGREEVYVRPFPDVGRRRIQVSTNGGTEPVWGADGRELFFRDGEGWMTAAQVARDPDFRVVSRERLFDASSYRSDFNHRAYDVAPAGERFVMIRTVDRAAEDAGALIAVENWFRELRSAMEER